MVDESGHPNGVEHGTKVGLLTRTIVASPVIRWILPARIRHRKLNDVVFVGEDFIEVKEVKLGGHVEPVISKHDLGSRICSAKVFTIEDPSIPVEEDSLQHGIDYADLPSPVLPAQLLVLTLEANAVMFLYLARTDHGNAEFRYQVIPLVRWPDALRQTGEHLAIDPQSRAMAIASRGGGMVLYSARDKQEFKDQLIATSEDWCPVTQELEVNVGGSIQHIAFLHPQRSDTKDHVILLVVVTDPQTKRTRLKWYDWNVAAGVRRLQQHGPYSIAAPRCVSSLLIPLCNSNFILIHGKDINLYKNLLSGTPCVEGIDTIGDAAPPVYPGNSPMHPLWINWCRPMRSPNAVQDRDFLYLCREDGKVFHLIVEQDGTMQAGSAGDLQCHVGEAFASLGDDRNPDLLAVAADMSTGRIVSIGDWQTNRVYDRSREETMDMKHVELLPNWASVTDMIVTRITSSHTRSSRNRDSVFLSSGRQPYGTITEIRRGYEARLSTYIPLDDLSSTLGIWALPDPPTGRVIFLLTTPESTDVYLMLSDEKMKYEPGCFETAARTIAADVTRHNHLVQVTEKTIIVATDIEAGFEDKDAVRCEHDESIVCAAIEPEQSLIMTCRSKDVHYSLAIHLTPTSHEVDDAIITAGPSIILKSRPLCMASVLISNEVLILVADDGGLVNAFVYSENKLRSIGSFSLDKAREVLCDQMVILRSLEDTTCQDGHFVAVCGTRDGRLLTVAGTTAPFSASAPVERSFGHSTVKLIRLSSESHEAYAICGTDTCLLTLNESSMNNISITSIWVADKNRPELLQNHVVGCARMPLPDRLSSSSEGGLNMLGGFLVMVSADELWITSLSHDISTIPRQIAVTGTPFRLIYAPAQRSLVCASMYTELTDTGNRRRCIPHIEFISPKTNLSTASYQMEPGEDVYSLLAWSPQSTEKNASYQFVLVGSKFLKNGNEDEVRGRVTFLQSQKDGSVKCQHTLTLEAAVYAMELYDDLTFAVCYGKYVALYRFSFEKHKVQAICQPIRMASSGAAITCRVPMVYVTTTEDSVIALRVEDRPSLGTETCRLVVSSSGPRGDAGISHAIKDELALAVMSTRRKEVIGLALPREVADGLARAADIGFEATLPQSVTRVRTCDIQPPWRPAPSDGVLEAGLLGCCTNGSLVGLAVLDKKLWRRLFWLQRLCEWNAIISPHSYEEAPYAVSQQYERGSDRALPIGFADGVDVMLAAPDEPDRAARDMHIDGDVLARLLERGGLKALREMIMKTSERQDHIGQWVRAHLATELDAADGCIAELDALLNLWL